MTQKPDNPLAWSQAVKVRVTRTSGGCGDKKPCNGTKKEVFDRCEMRSCTERYFDGNFAHNEGLWRSKGERHGVYDGGIVRYHKNGDTGWFMYLDGMAGLKKFLNKHGPCVVSTCDDAGASLQIEIYDDYRE